MTTNTETLREALAHALAALATCNSNDGDDPWFDHEKVYAAREKARAALSTQPQPAPAEAAQPVACWCCGSPNWPAGSGGIEHAGVMNPVGKRLTEEERARTDGKAGAFIWWADVAPGAMLYATPTTQPAPEAVPAPDRFKCPDCGERTSIKAGIESCTRCPWWFEMPELAATPPQEQA